MKTIPEYKRAKVTGKGGKALHLGIDHWIIDTPKFKALKGSDVKMLVHLGRQYNGHNNGNFSVHAIRQHWNSRSGVQRILRRLIDGGWIIKTRLGGLGMGPDLYAITWWPIDACKGKHDYPPETRASHLWNKKTPDLKQVLTVPTLGTSEQETRSQNDHAVPEAGTRNGNFKAA